MALMSIKYNKKSISMGDFDNSHEKVTFLSTIFNVDKFWSINKFGDIYENSPINNRSLQNTINSYFLTIINMLFIPIKKCCLSLHWIWFIFNENK